MSGFAKLLSPKGKLWIVALLVGAFHVECVIRYYPNNVLQFYFFKHARPVEAICDMKTLGGGWTVILDRIGPNSNLGVVEFNRSMHDYKVGFGTPPGDYWIGLDAMHQLTKLKNFELKVELSDFKGEKAHAAYEQFSIRTEEEGYTLDVANYTGNAGDGFRIEDLGNP